MTFGGEGGGHLGIAGLQQKDCTDLIRTAFDAEINFIDTANA